VRLSSIHRAVAVHEARTAAKVAGVALVGFAIDAGVLRAGLALHLSPAVARAISLFLAMQGTFAINGLVVFRCLTRERLIHHWLGYMTTNGFGNFCNYWIFVTLVSLHKPMISNYYLALGVSSFCAWGINYFAMRVFVFGRAKTRAETVAPADCPWDGAAQPPTAPEPERSEWPRRYRLSQSTTLKGLRARRRSS
jgi:putative flippase GtrA